MTIHGPRKRSGIIPQKLPLTLCLARGLSISCEADKGDEQALGKSASCATWQSVEISYLGELMSQKASP